MPCFLFEKPCKRQPQGKQPAAHSLPPSDIGLLNIDKPWAFAFRELLGRTVITTEPFPQFRRDGSPNSDGLLHG